MSMFGTYDEAMGFAYMDDDRDYAEEAYNAHTLHTNDGDTECTDKACPSYVEPRIRCGRCHGKHTTAAFVRACYAAYDEMMAEAEADARAERAYAEALERRSEHGGWFGFGD